MNRRKLGLLTASIALVIAMIEGVLTLFRTKAVLSAFGDSTNAIMQVAVQLTNYLVLIESGMTAAYQLKLYKPISAGDRNRVSELYLGLKKNMLTIVIRMTIAINICSCIYVFLLLNTEESRLQSFLIFLVMGLRFVTPYLLTIQERTLLFASERGYVSNIIQGILHCSTLLVETVLCYYTKLPLSVILFSYIIGIFISKLLYVAYRRCVLKLEINPDVKPDMEPKQMTGDILVHQVSGMITSNTDNILLSIMSKLINVTIYSSFYTVMNFPITLFNSIIGSMKASVIIKIQKQDRNSFDTYENVLKLACAIMAVVSSVFFLQINSFVILWIGQQYVLDFCCVALFTSILFLQVVLNVVTIGIDAVGLYKETKKYAVWQAITNFMLTVLLVPICGIKGALIGTVVSFAFIKLPFMSKCVYRSIFNSKNQGITIVLSGITATFLSILVGYLITKGVSSSSWSRFICSTGFCSIGSVLTVFLWYYLTERNTVDYFTNDLAAKVFRKQ